MIIVLMLLGVGELLAFGLTVQALVYPGWAYKQAHRSKVLWVLAGLVAFVPLLASVAVSPPAGPGARRGQAGGRRAMPRWTRGSLRRTSHYW